MLELRIPAAEFFNEADSTFVHTDEQVLCLEHSLVSLSKWESKWHKPFLGNDKMTSEEILDYVRCMTLTPNVSPLVYYSLRDEDFKKINDYLNDSMTATWFSDKENKHFSREVITAEIIYYWMVTLQIPFECQHWHLNRLLTLVRVCNEKNRPPKKMSKKELFSRNRALNAARKSRLGTHG